MIKRILFLMLLTSAVNATDILLTWTKPETRSDGSQIIGIDRYDILHSVDNIVQDDIEVQADATFYTLVDATKGNHSFMIRAVESGLKGDLTRPVNEIVGQAQIGKLIFSVQVIE
jgi:hypothetical protein